MKKTPGFLIVQLFILLRQIQKYKQNEMSRHTAELQFLKFFKFFFTFAFRHSLRRLLERAALKILGQSFHRETADTAISARIHTL